MRLIRFFLLLSIAFCQHFTLEGDAGSVFFKGDSSYTMYNQDSFTLSDSQNAPALEFVSAEDCKMTAYKRLLVHGNLLGSTSKSFKVQNYEQWKLVIVEDFQGKITGWSKDDISKCGTSPDLFLGGHCKFSGVSVKKSFKLPAHSFIKVQLTVHFLDRWQGESVFMKIDNKLVWSESYQACNNLHSSMCHTKGIDVCGDDFPDRMGFPTRFIGKHSSENLDIEIFSNMKKDSCEASWGIDDLQISIK